MLVAPYAVVPINDLIDHDDYNQDCVCGPTLLLEQTNHGDEWIIVHNALDGRS